MPPRGDGEAIKASESATLDWTWLQSLNPKHLGKQGWGPFINYVRQKGGEGGQEILTIPLYKSLPDWWQPHPI